MDCSLVKASSVETGLSYFINGFCDQHYVSSQVCGLFYSHILTATYSSLPVLCKTISTPEQPYSHNMTKNTPSYCCNKYQSLCYQLCLHPQSLLELFSSSCSFLSVLWKVENFILNGVPPYLICVKDLKTAQNLSHPSMYIMSTLQRIPFFICYPQF